MDERDPFILTMVGVGALLMILFTLSLATVIDSGKDDGLECLEYETTMQTQTSASYGMKVSPGMGYAYDGSGLGFGVNMGSGGVYLTNKDVAVSECVRWATPVIEEGVDAP